MNTPEQIQAEIERLIPKAETGEQWAEICLLETKLVEAICRQMGVPYSLANLAGKEQSR